MHYQYLSQYDYKRNVGIVHGVHQTKELQTKLNTFIREFILCPKCKLPDLQFKVHQKKAVLLQNGFRTRTMNRFDGLWIRK